MAAASVWPLGVVGVDEAVAQAVVGTRLQAALDPVCAALLLPPISDLDVAFFLTHLAVMATVVWGQLALLALIHYAGWLRPLQISPQQQAPPELARHAYLHFAGINFLQLTVGSLLFRPALNGMHGGPSPPLHVWVGYIVLYFAAMDTYFYWGHRLFHHKAIYKYVHKKHHLFRNPIGVTAFYAHPIEDIVINLGSTLVGPVLFPSHWAVVVTYLAIRYYETIDVHSGYDFPWSVWRLLGPLHGGSRKHDFHHSKNVGSYGAFFFWDWLCGTDQAFLAYERKRAAKQAALAKRSE